MTNEEHINRLKAIREYCCAKRDRESLDYAIKKLEQETCKTCVYYCPDGYCRHSSLTIAEVEQ